MTTAWRRTSGLLTNTAKVRRFYDTQMNLPGATAIEFFTGPHTIHGEGTFEFLRKHLRLAAAESVMTGSVNFPRRRLS